MAENWRDEIYEGAARGPSPAREDIKAGKILPGERERAERRARERDRVIEIRLKVERGQPITEDDYVFAMESEFSFPATRQKIKEYWEKIKYGL